MTVPQAPLPPFLRPLFVIVDVGFIAYWAITLAGVIPMLYPLWFLLGPMEGGESG